MTLLGLALTLILSGPPNCTLTLEENVVYLLLLGGDTNLILFLEWVLVEIRLEVWVLGKAMGVTVIFL